MADAAATTVETWWNEGFFPEKDVTFRALVADYERASGSKIDYDLVPNSSIRLNGKRDSTRRSFKLKTRLRCYAVPATCNPPGLMIGTEIRLGDALTRRR